MSNVIPTNAIRIANETTQFQDLYSIGTRIYVVSTEKLYYTTIPILETDTPQTLLNTGYLIPIEPSTGLIQVTENNKTGWRLYGVNPTYFAPIGDSALDFSHSDTYNSSYGASGDNSIAFGFDVEASGVGSFAGGMHTKASGKAAFAIGLGLGGVNEVSGDAAFSFQQTTKDVNVAAQMAAVLGGYDNAIEVTARKAVVLGGHDQVAKQENMVYIMGHKYWGYTTAERDALQNVEEGTEIYNKDKKQIEYWDGTSWISGRSASGTDELVAVNSSMVPGYLVDVLEAGKNVVLTPDPANNSLKIDVPVQWGDIEGDITNQTDLIQLMGDYEPYLDVPSSDDMVLASLADGTRYWKSIDSVMQIIRPPKWTGDGATKVYVMPGAVEGEIVDIHLVTVGGVPQSMGEDYNIASAVVSRDAVEFITPPDIGTEIWIEYYRSVSSLIPPEGTTRHNSLEGRSEDGAHPISAIIDLQDELNAKIDKNPGHQGKFAMFTHEGNLIPVDGDGGAGSGYLRDLLDVDMDLDEKDNVLVYDDVTNMFVLMPFNLGRLSDVVLDDTIPDYSVLMYNQTTGWSNVELDSIGAGAWKVAVNDGDKGEFLENKMIAGAGITLQVVQKDSEHRAIEITSDGSGGGTFKGLSDTPSAIEVNKFLKGNASNELYFTDIYLNDMGDVYYDPAIATGDILVYDLATHMWYSAPNTGGGDMLKSIYDTGDTGVVDDSEALETHPGSYYLDRANHTGEQPISTITDLQDELDGKAPLVHTHEFIDLTDTPADWTDSADKFIKVNSAGDALVFSDAPPGSGIPDAPSDGTMYGRKDANWEPIAGGGDMTKAVYDTGNTGVVDDAEMLGSQLPAYYLDRTNHTGTQPISSIESLQDTLDNKADLNHSHAFTSLTDVPTTYNGQAGKIPAVNSAEDALIFIDPPSGGGGIPDAPIDGNTYARLDGSWTAFTPGIGEAPDDGNYYSRNQGGWGIMSSGDLLDVTLSGVATLDMLIWNGFSWQNVKKSDLFTFLDLEDTPPNYTGKAGYSVHVNEDANGLEFVPDVTVGTIELDYRFNTGTGASDPGAGYVKLNNATYSSVTKVYISETTRDGSSAAGMLEALKTDDVFIIVDSNTNKYVSFRVDRGSTVDNGDWWEIPVVFKKNEHGTFNNGERCKVGAIFMGASAGASSYLELTDTPNNYVGDQFKVVGVTSQENGLEHIYVPRIEGQTIQDYFNMAIVDSLPATPTSNTLYFIPEP